MTRDDIIRMAREAGFAHSWSDAAGDALERFAALVAAAERAACCMTIYGLCASDNNAFQMVEAIRARGEQ